MNRVAVRFEQTINKLDDVFRLADKTLECKEKEIFLSFLTIKLHDQWNFRSRQIVLASFGGSEGEMMKVLRGCWSSKKPMEKSWEPDWHIPANSIRAARLLQVPHEESIVNALGAVIHIDDLRWTRNAIVHNIPTSFAKFQQRMLGKHGLRSLMPYQLAALTNSQDGVTFYETWCSEMLSAIRAAM